MSNKGRAIARQANRQNNNPLARRSELSRQDDLEPEARITARAQFAMYARSGPLPAPEELAKYEMASHGTADRIITMAEKQQSHRMDLEKAVVMADIASSKRGQFLGTFLSVCACSAGTYAIHLGHAVEGSSLIGTTMVTLAGVFAYGRYRQENERKEKAKIQAGETSPEDQPKIEK